MQLAASFLLLLCSLMLAAARAQDYSQYDLLEPGQAKRAWNSGFNSGLGKRAWNSQFSSGMGKRAWNSNFSGGLGKRAWDSDFSRGLDKRRWNSGFSGGMGKRSFIPDEEKKLGKREAGRENTPANSWNPKALRGAWGKRGKGRRDWQGMRGMWGKRAAAEQQQDEDHRGELEVLSKPTSGEQKEGDKGRKISEGTKEKGTESTNKARLKVDEGGRAKKPFIYVTPSKNWQAGHRTAMVKMGRGRGVKRTRAWMQLRGMWGRKKRSGPGDGTRSGEEEEFYPLQHPRGREDDEVIAQFLTQ